MKNIFKVLGVITIVAVIGFSFASCDDDSGGGGGGTPVPVTGVSLNKSSLSLDVGSSETLTVTVAPSNATNKAVTWRSNNTAIATVTNGGVVRAVAAGSAIITVTTADGGRKAECSVDVNDPSLSTLSGTITISPATATVGTQLTATYSGNETVSYRWEKDGSSVGTDSNKYTPTAEGSYTVTVSAAGYNNKTSNTVTVTTASSSGNPVWPTEFEGSTQTGTNWGKTSNPNPRYINFYTSTGGSGISAYMQFSDSMYGFRLVSVNGETLKVKSNSKEDSETEYTLCTSWIIISDYLILSGGDSLFSNIMDIPLGKNGSGIGGTTVPTITTSTLPNGAAGTAYNETLEATGAPITWSLESDTLPTGLTLSRLGEISGTPTTAGTSTFTVKATNATGNVTKQLSIIVTATTITTTSLPNGIVGTAYSQTLTATGGMQITWSIDTGTLPAGLALSNAGIISGTPTTEGTSTFTVKATNDAGYVTKQLSITIKVAPTITTTSLPDGTVGKAYSRQTLTATGTTPITWSIDTGRLPTGLTLSRLGEISGTPTTEGTSTFTVKATNDAGYVTKQLLITIKVAPTITTTSLPAGAVGTAYSQTLTATGGMPITWSIDDTSTLPAGLTLSNAGIISGTPTTSANYTFTVKAANDAGYVTKQLSITILVAPTITTTSLPDGLVGRAYSQKLIATGTWPTWSLESGTLPTGLTLSSLGEISGTPTTTGTSTFTVKATNAGGSETKSLSIVISKPWTAVTDSTFGTSAILAITYGNGKFVAGGGNYGKMATSTDGTTWTAVTNSIFGQLEGIYAIAYGNGKFVAGGTYGKIVTSTDGTTWTTVTNSTFDTSHIRAIAYGNGKFVAGGYNGKMATSTDGITWTAVDASSIFGSNTYRGIEAIAYGNGKFVAGGNDGKMATSTNGETWTAVTDSTFGTSVIYAITYGNGKFVAGGENGKMATSTDDETWTAVTDSTFGSGNIYAIAYGNNKFVAGGSHQTSSGYGKMATSTDGETWTAVADNVFGLNSRINAITYDNGKFVAGTYDGQMAYLSDD